MPCRSSILSARAASIRSLSRRSRPSRIRFEEGGVALVVLSLAYSKGPHYDQFIALLGEQSEQAKLACRRTSSSVSLGVRRMRRVFSAATPRLTTRARGALPRPTQRQWPMRSESSCPTLASTRTCDCEDLRLLNRQNLSAFRIPMHRHAAARFG